MSDEKDLSAEEVWKQMDAEEKGIKQEEAANLAADSEEQTAEEAVEAADEAADKPNQELLDRIAGLEQLVDKFQVRIRKAEGRLGELNSTLKQQTAVAQQVRDAGGDAPTTTEIREAQNDPEKVRQLREDYPDFAEAIEELVSHRLKERQPKAPVEKEEAKPAEEQPEPSLEQSVEALANQKLVEFAHEGWQKTVTTPHFLGWFNRQPDEVKALAMSTHPKDAIALLDAYKGVKAKPSKTDNLRSAAAIGSKRGSSAGRTKNLDEMNEKELWAYYEAQDRAASA